MRYHESLPVLAEIALQYEIPLDDLTVFVRDGAGRLILVRETVPDHKAVEAGIRARLGGYAGAIALVTGPSAKRLISQSPLGYTDVIINQESRLLRYFDRRVVGMDWLRTPTVSNALPRRLVFGSLKGGVGRSTALSVLAADLAKAGKRVLAIDLDLEAPGIGFMLLPESDDPSIDRRPRFGVIDYLIEERLDGVSDEELYDFVGVSPFSEGAIDVIPATGRETDERPWLMIEKLSHALVEDHSDGTITSVADQISNMVDRFVARGNYDAILIDARAGLAEITAAPLLALGAEILLFGTDQPQTFRGYSYLLAHLVKASDFSELNKECDWRRRISFVQSKAPAASSKREKFRDSLYDLCSDYLYDEERLENGQVTLGGFSPGPEAVGNGVPHDSLYIQYHPDYDAFDPVGDLSQLDSEVYTGPFGGFLERAADLLELQIVRNN